MMMSMRGRGQRTGVRRLGNTAGPWTTSRIHMSPGAGPARGTWTGPLTLSSSAVMSRSMVSGGVLASGGSVRSSLAIRTSWSVAFQPVGAGPSRHRDAGSHELLGFMGLRRPDGRFFHLRSLRPRTSGCLGSFGLGQSVATGTLGRKLEDLFWSMYFNWVVHGLMFLGFLHCFRCWRRLMSFLLFIGLGLRLPSLKQPILTDVAGWVFCNTRSALRLVDTAGSESGCHYACESECTPGTLAEIQRKTTGHVIWNPPFVHTGTAWHGDENKLDFWPHATSPKRSHLRPTDELHGSHKLSSFCARKSPWKATGTVHDWTHVRTRARQKSKWTTGGYGALRRCGCSRSGKRTQFHCLKFRLGSAGQPTICSHCYDVLNEDNGFWTKTGGWEMLHWRKLHQYDCSMEF